MPRPKKEQPNHAGGLYEVKITIGKTIDGKLIRKSFYSSISKADAREQAEKWKIDKKVAETTGSNFVSENVTFGEWATKWLALKKPQVDENTYITTYQNTVVNHLIPYFGNAALKDIRQIDVQEFFNLRVEKSKSSLEKMRMCLSNIFDSAIDNDLCFKNPARKVDYASKRPKNKKNVYTDTEINLIEAIAANEMPEIVFLLETGLRRGELLGLDFDKGDVDWSNGILHVRRSVTEVKGGGVKTNPPKWGSFRDLPLNDNAMTVLKSLPHRTGPVFPNTLGQTQYPSVFSRRLSRFMARVNKLHPEIKILSAHELRHTYGTALRRRGVDIYSIQKLMGHKDINVTTETYVKNEIEVLKKAIKKIG